MAILKSSWEYAPEHLILYISVGNNLCLQLTSLLSLISVNRTLGCFYSFRIISVFFSPTWYNFLKNVCIFNSLLHNSFSDGPLSASFNLSVVLAKGLQEHPSFALEPEAIFYCQHSRFDLYFQIFCPLERLQMRNKFSLQPGKSWTLYFL